MSFNDIVLKALSDITGITVDLTTVCVGVIVIVVILCGLDFLKDVLLGHASGSSEKKDNVSFESCDASLKKIRRQENFMNKKYGRGHSRSWDLPDDKYI